MADNATKALKTSEVEIDLATMLTPIAIIVGSLIIAVTISLSIIFGLRGASFGGAGAVQAAECDPAAPLAKDCLVNYAQKIGIDTGKFTQCLDAKSSDNKIQDDLNYGQQVGVQGTPAMYVGENKGEKMTGFSVGAGASLADLKELADRINSQGIQAAATYWKEKQVAGLGAYETQLRDYYKQQGQAGDALEATVKEGLDKQKLQIEQDVQVKDYEYSSGQKLGNNSAKAVMVQFTDFECPFCKRYAQGIGKQVQSELIEPGKMLFVIRDFPLESIHPSARRAALAANCAGEQGKYFEYHDEIFEVNI